MKFQGRGDAIRKDIRSGAETRLAREEDKSGHPARERREERCENASGGVCSCGGMVYEGLDRRERNVRKKTEEP
jgi:hypothetical protein